MMFLSSKLYLEIVNTNAEKKHNKTGQPTMKKVALPITKSQLSPVFEQSSEFIIFCVENNNCIKKDLVYTRLQPGLFPYWLAKKGVTDIITRGIDINDVSKFNQFKINVFAGVNVFDPELLMEEFLDGTLETNGTMVGN